MEIIYAPCKNTLLYIGYLKSIPSQETVLSAPYGKGKNVTKELMQCHCGTNFIVNRWVFNILSSQTLYGKCHSNNTLGQRHNNNWSTIRLGFSAPEPKPQVYYCDHALSVRH